MVSVSSRLKIDRVFPGMVCIINDSSNIRIGHSKNIEMVSVSSRLTSDRILESRYGLSG